MHDPKRQFIEFVLARQVLRFGEFTLKSGRISPYFFNTGLIDSGAAICALGRWYAEALMTHGPDFDMLYGPAYKGIPLATATAIALHTEHGRDVPFAYNRKLAKDHGEGGTLVGAPLRGRVVIVDDVISAGTSVAESVAHIKQAGAAPAGVAIAMDRQERGWSERTAVEDVEERWGMPVIPIITLDDLVGWLERDPAQAAELLRMRAYRATYGRTS
jgi:orotate phosphoribosyltransferase